MPRFCVLLLLPAALLGEARKLMPSAYYHTFSGAHPPLARIRPGDFIATKTLDAGGQDEQGVFRSEGSNPLTGPFYIEGAQPGDSIAVRFTRMRMNRSTGWSSYRLSCSPR